MIAIRTHSTRQNGVGKCSSSGHPTTFRSVSSIPYNSNNQRTSTNFSYDGNGNCTELNNVDCYYDNANRLTVYEPYHSGTNSYWNTACNYCGDGLMGERAKHVYNYNNGLWVETDSAPTNIYNLDGHPAYETDGESESFNVFAPDGLVARKQNGNWIYYQFDQQGNVAQRLNSSGTVLNSSSYDAYGNQALNGSTQNDPWAYNAQWGYVRDVDTGLYYCQNRWYDPATGRWLNRDPIGYGGGANLYGYCGGMPVGAADPSGLVPLFWPPSFGVPVKGQPWTASLGGRKPSAMIYPSYESFEEIYDREYSEAMSMASRAQMGILGETFSFGAWQPSDEVRNSAGYQDGLGWAGFGRDCLMLAGTAGGASALGFRAKVGLHGPHHTFGKLGKLPHFQINLWREGVKDSGSVLRLPLHKGAPYKGKIR